MCQLHAHAQALVCVLDGWKDVLLCAFEFSTRTQRTKAAKLADIGEREKIRKGTQQHASDKVRQRPLHWPHVWGWKRRDSGIVVCENENGCEIFIRYKSCYNIVAVDYCVSIK